MRHAVLHVAIVTVLSGLMAIPGLAPVAAQPAQTVTPIAESADTRFLTALDSFLTFLNGGVESMTPEDLEDVVAPSFLAGVPPEFVLAVLQQVAADAPYELEGFSRPPTAYQANAIVRGRSDVEIAIPVAVEPEAPHRITGMTFAPVPTLPNVQLQVLPVDTAPLSEGEVRHSETGRLDALIEIDGRQLYLSCIGEGNPTVVLESGLGDAAAPWFGVESAVAGFTRVCSYDRPNTTGGASDPAAQPRTAGDAVADLHALLTAADVPGPYVLVGHSLGGIIVRLFASEYPDDVAGIVLVDSSHEDQEVRLEALVTPEQWAEYQALLKQFTGEFELEIEASFDQMREARQQNPLPPVPLVVISAGIQVASPILPSGWPIYEMEQLHSELQADLATLVPDGRRIVAEQSGHYVHQTEPGVVIAAIHDVVEAVRDPNTWSTPAAETPVLATPAGTPVP